MSPNQTLVNPQQTSYPLVNNYLYEAVPFPTATPYNIWNSGMDWHNQGVRPRLMTDCYYNAPLIGTGMPSDTWNSETNRQYQSAPIQTGMPSSTWNSETNCHYHAASVPSAMPRSTSDPELTMQRIPWSEFQNLGAMRLFRHKMHCAAQMMSAQVNPQNCVNFRSNPVNALSVDDEFMMYRFKVEKCPTNRGHHDWTDCPYLHTGEKARRRDPRKYLYSGKPCAEFRKRGQCENGDRCHFSHGVFETWLHPDKYKTQMCRDLAKCQRKVCFFAHSPSELREGDGVKEDVSFDFSPKSVLSMDQSPPESPKRFLNNDTIRGMETNHNTIKGMEMNNDTIRNMEIHNDTIRGMDMHNDTIRGTDNLLLNSAPNGFQNFANGAGYSECSAIDHQNSDFSSEEINIKDCPHIIWINGIVDS